MNSIRLLMYVLSALTVVGFDRLTKWYALQHFHEVHQVNEILSLQLSFNRGISWGLFNNTTTLGFVLVTLSILAVIMMVAFDMVREYRNNVSVFGHILVLAGAISNVFDRVLYPGVVDFIMFSYHGLSWPSFNIADCAIVLGAFLMLYNSFGRKP